MVDDKIENEEWESFGTDDARKRAGLTGADKAMPFELKVLASQLWKEYRKKHPKDQTVEEDWLEQIGLREALRRYEATKAPEHESRTREEENMEIPLKPFKLWGKEVVDPIIKLEIQRKTREDSTN